MSLVRHKKFKQLIGYRERKKYKINSALKKNGKSTSLRNLDFSDDMDKTIEKDANRATTRASSALLRRRKL